MRDSRIGTDAFAMREKEKKNEEAEKYTKKLNSKKKASLHVRESGIRMPANFAVGIRNPQWLGIRNPQWFGIRIPLWYGIRNPESFQLMNNNIFKSCHVVRLPQFPPVNLLKTRFCIVQYLQ